MHSLRVILMVVGIVCCPFFLYRLGLPMYTLVYLGVAP